MIVVCITLPKLIAARGPVRIFQLFSEQVFLRAKLNVPIADALNCNGSESGGRYDSAHSAIREYTRAFARCSPKSAAEAAQCVAPVLPLRGRELPQVAPLQRGIRENVVEKGRGFASLVQHRRERQQIARARHRNVEKAAFLLNVKIPDRQLLLHQRCGKFEHARPFPRWKSAVHQVEHEHAVEFEPLGGVHRHELHRVSRFLLEIDLPVGLLEVVQIFRELAQSSGLAFQLPLGDEIAQPRDVFAVVRIRDDAHFELPQHFIEQLDGGNAPRALLQTRDER